MWGNDTPWKHQWDYPGIFHRSGLYWGALDCTKTGALLRGRAPRQVVQFDYWLSIVNITMWYLCMLSWKGAASNCVCAYVFVHFLLHLTRHPKLDRAFLPLDKRIARLDNILPQCTLAFMGVYAFPRLGNIRLSRQFDCPADPEMIWRNRHVGTHWCYVLLHTAEWTHFALFLKSYLLYSVSLIFMFWFSALSTEKCPCTCWRLWFAVVTCIQAISY